MKIDILEAYVWMSEVFRVKSGFYRSTGGYGNPWELNGPIWALVEIEGSKGSLGRAPQGPNRIRLGQGEPPPSFLLLLSLSFSRILFQLGKGGVGLLLVRPLPGRPHPPLLVYIRGQGGTSRHNN